MYELHEILRLPLEKIRTGARQVEVSELWGSARALFLLNLFRESGGHLLAVTAGEDEAETLAEDLRFFADKQEPRTGTDVLLFPPWGVLPFEADSPDSGTVGERMRVLYRLVTGGPCIVISPVHALMQKLPSWQLFADSVRTVDAGGETDPDELADALASTGYEHTSTVTRVGEFSRRGGIIDLFSPEHPNPVRLEFFGETVESIREFDPETQRSIGGIRRVVVLPVRELIVTGDGIERLRRQLIGTAGEPGEKDREVIDRLQDGDVPPGAEFLAPFCYDMDPLFRYLPAGAVTAIIETDDCGEAVDEWMRKIVQGREEEIGGGRSLPDVASLYIGNEDIDAETARHPLVRVSLLGTEADRVRMDTRSPASLGVRLTSSLPVDQARGDVEGTVADLAGKIKNWREQNRVVIVCGTSEAAARLPSLFHEHGLFITPGAFPAERSDGPGPVTVLTGRLSAGFSWPALRLIVITDEEIFGRKVHRPRPRRSKAAPFLTSFKELKPGDFVVHTDYGVGEYLGLTHLTVDGFSTDLLTLRYEPAAKLYVPLYSLDKVQKYVGTEGAPPKVNRLGAPAWARTKERVKKDLLAMAHELARIYAARESMHRKPLAPPDNLYREFEAAFPFEETPDQQKAIEDVLEDMQKPRPMDRLVCGDVGFGKTEVALRSAFKAVEDGFQAAVIVPTTLLADQHYRTFSERLAAFSATVDLLSRFRTRSEQQTTLKALKAGTVDIVIGTHRLLQKDVVFKNLGLLVIDEEHRFGVRHKERIKEMRRMVDVLTLTATPIPRTLHMSLAGIRDLSIIQTPPLDRQAIQVVLARFGKRVIREAVTKEIERNGQVFFVQNRVQGIERMAAYIQNLVPEAKIGVAHGQMKEDEIETVMEKFVAGELNVLVTTTIIESGIDIPNANTIIINRADRFGLAELYQIKGRVGRSRQKAYAYLLTPADETLSDVARTRLRAIQELSELGAGFRIAAQDLESRGAGNLLGKQQSGHIAAVGIDLYTQMMEEAMAELRGEEVREAQDTQINLRASAFLPESYIRDVNLRLAAYKEIAAAGSEDELAAVAADLQDRFGRLPEEAGNLLEIMGLKVLARASRVNRIDGGTESVSITFAEDAGIPPDRVMGFIKRSGGRVKLIPEYTLRIALPDQQLATASRAVKKCLQELG
jgi:transcription-repair coupling factor (superfamily II helicase)